MKGVMMMTPLRAERKRRGGVLPFWAIALTGLVASSSLALDLGYVALWRMRLQQAADAGALAGAIELAGDLKSQSEREADAILRGQEIALENAGAQYDVSFPLSQDCTVSATKNVPLFFAKAAGMNSINVHASATARIAGVRAIRGLRPFGIEEPEEGFEFGESYYLKLGPKDGTEPTEALHGNFHALAIGASGANTYRNNVKYGADTVVRVGDWLPTEPGNMSGPTDQGIEYLMQQEIIQEGVEYIIEQDHIAWEWYELHPDELDGSPRVITIPVVGSWDGVYGRSNVEIVGFAMFFLEGIAGTGKDSFVIGRFVKGVAPGVVESGGSSFGAFAVRLAD